MYKELASDLGIASPSHGFLEHWATPREMNQVDMDQTLAAFVQSAQMADCACFDLIELHMAHGYLLSSFLSPLSNHRCDEFGGSLANRMRYPMAVFEA
ncbi:MAG: hypothetical protein JKY56_14245, partial [Kofleriaceae bacterium]|nr:hypothetical protein [Kofleriaceae bacterium]